MPDGALVAGYESDGTQLYAALGPDAAGGLCARTAFLANDCHTWAVLRIDTWLVCAGPGKIQRGWDRCSVGWGGAERNLSPCHCICVPSGTRPPRDEAAPPRVSLADFEAR